MSGITCTRKMAKSDVETIYGSTGHQPDDASFIRIGYCPQPLNVVIHEDQKFMFEALFLQVYA